jgi:hypothetical protein
MACHLYPVPGGMAVVCTRGPQPSCQEPGCSGRTAALCDWPLEGAHAGKTCSRRMCASHRTKVGIDLDYCGAHARRRDTKPPVVDGHEEITMGAEVGSGKHKAKAMRAWLTKSPKKGTDGVCIDFKVSGGMFDGGGITWTGWLTDTTVDRTVESLRNCGWKGDELADLSTVNGEAEIVVEEETFTGRDGEERVSYRVQWVNKLGGRGFAAVEAVDAKSLSARMKERVRASDRAREAADEGKGSNPL